MPSLKSGKLTDMDKAELYGNRIKKAERAMAKWVPDARKRVERYENKATAESFSIMGHRINTPTGTAIIDSMFSSLTAVDVQVAVRPQAKGTLDQARVAESAIKEVWKEQKVSERAKYAIKDALIVGIGWLKVSYEYVEHTEVKAKTPEDFDQEIGAIYEQAAQEGSPPPDPQAFEGWEPNKEVVVVDRDRVVVDYLPWDKVLWDPTAKRYEDVEWIGHVDSMRPEDVQDNPEWQEYVKAHSGQGLKPLKNLQPDSYIEKERYGYERNEEFETTEDDARVTVYQFHNLRRGTICTFARGEKWLLNEQPLPTAFADDMEDRNLYVPLVLRDDPDNVRGIADMELIIPSLDELNRHRSALINHIERYVTKVIGPERAFTDAGKEAFESKVPAYVGLEEGVDATQVQPLQPPQLPSEVYALSERIENQIREATGVSEIMRGIFPDRKRTATETTEVVAASAARQAEKRSLMETFYTNVARRVLFFLQMTDEERVTRLAEEGGDVVWEWTPEDITMEADLEVALAPKEYFGPAEKEERAMKLINFVGALPDDIVDRAAVTKHALQEMGYPMTTIREILKLPEEAAQAKEQEIADQAAMAEAQGVGAASGDPNVSGGATAELGFDPLVPGQGPAVEAAMGMTELEGQEAGPMDYITGT